MLTYTFEQRGKTPYYQFLYQKMKEDILGKKLKAGEKLPSKRAFAKQLGLSVMTIETAYEQLVVEGYIISEEKRGYYVAQLDESYWQNTPKQQEVKEEKEEQPQEKERIHFGDNHIGSEYFPITIWSRIMRKNLRENSEKTLQTSPSQGVRELREEIANHLYRFRGIRVKTNQIVIGAGSEYFYQLLTQLFGNQIVYGLENPGYTKLKKIYENCRVDLVSVDLDSYGVSVEQLREKKVDVIHTSPSHHFPTGIVMPIQRRQQLLAWAKEEEKRYIIEDDYDCEFRFSGLPIPTLQSQDLQGKVIYMNTFSKSLSPGIRISYMVLPENLVESFQKKFAGYACPVPTFEQYTLADFLRLGYFEKHINRMRTFYRNQRNLVIDCIKESNLYPHITIEEEDAGLHFLMKVTTSHTEEELKRMWEVRGIRIQSLWDYALEKEKRKEWEHTYIINYTSIAIESLTEILNEMEKDIKIS